MARWWSKIRNSLKMLILPLIALQFVRTVFFPNPFDVLLMFALFLLFAGFMLDII